MPFNVKASRLETFHEACQGRTLTFEAALASDDLELVDAAAWACPLDLLLRQREQVCEDHSKGLDINQRGTLICYAADVRGTSEDAPHNLIAA